MRASAVAVLVVALGCGGQIAPSAAVGPDADTQDGPAADGTLGPEADAATTSDGTTAPDAPTADAGDASHDGPLADDGAPTADALPETSSDAIADVSVEASVDAGPDASVDAGPDAGIEAGPDAGIEAGPDCDNMCTLGESQCHVYETSCPDDGGDSCLSSALLTCALGAHGCTVWGPPAACPTNLACCNCYNGECVVDAGPGHGTGSYTCIICPLGPIGAPCTQDTDCGSSACDAVSLTCVASQCHDHRQDGNESDIDCGGDCGRFDQPYSYCQAGQRCNTNFDCNGLICTPAHVCE